MDMMTRRKHCPRWELWVTVIVTLTALAVVATADMEIDQGKAVGMGMEKKMEGYGEKEISDKTDGPKEKQFFIYYNPHAQERNEQIVSTDQGCGSKMFFCMYLEKVKQEQLL